jgi:hypothetical protein
LDEAIDRQIKVEFFPMKCLASPNHLPGFSLPGSGIEQRRIKLKWKMQLAAVTE